MQRNNIARVHKSVHKICKMLQKELSEIFFIHLLFFDHVFITVTSVHINTDLSTAKVYLSFTTRSEHNQKEIVLQKIIKQKNMIKRVLSTRIGSKMRRIPELKFYIDNSVDNAVRIQRLFDSLNI